LCLRYRMAAVCMPGVTLVCPILTVSPEVRRRIPRVVYSLYFIILTMQINQQITWAFVADVAGGVVGRWWFWRNTLPCGARPACTLRGGGAVSSIIIILGVSNSGYLTGVTSTTVDGRMRSDGDVGLAGVLWTTVFLCRPFICLLFLATSNLLCRNGNSPLELLHILRLALLTTGRCAALRLQRRGTFR